MNSAFLDKELSRGGTFGLYNRTDGKKIENYIVSNNQSQEKELSFEEKRRKEVTIEVFNRLIERRDS
jgi:hypothetical protein